MRAPTQPQTSRAFISFKHLAAARQELCLAVAAAFASTPLPSVTFVAAHHKGTNWLPATLTSMLACGFELKFSKAVGAQLGLCLAHEASGSLVHPYSSWQRRRKEGGQRVAEGRRPLTEQPPHELGRWGTDGGDKVDGSNAALPRH